jgi:putative MATE family efflux protein
VGAGLATLISQALALVLFVAVARRGADRALLALGPRDFAAARASFVQVTRVALPAVGERVVLNVAIMTYVTVLGHYGTAEVAAYGIGTRLMSFSWIPGTGFSVAAATLVGQSLGARDPEGAQRAGWRAARFALGVSIVLGLAFGVAREPIARVFTSDQGVVEALGPFMLLLALAQPPMGVHFTLGGALRGAGDTWTVLLAAALGNWGFRVPFAFFASAGLHLDVIWVWAALIADHFARAVWLTIAFRRGKWQQKLGG